MHQFLESLMSPQIEQFRNIRHTSPSDPTFLPIHLTGGVGDIIISTDAIKFLQKRFNLVVYTYHVEAFKYFYRDPISVFKEMPDYTWKLEFNTFVKFHQMNYFHGFLIKNHDNLCLQQQDFLKKHPRLETILKSHFNKFFLIAYFAKEMGQNRWSFPLYSLGYEEPLKYEFLPNNIPEKYITVHDGFDVYNASIVSGRATKTWKWEHWNSLVKMLKKKYPDYKIIQLGSKTSREIDGVDSCLINKTSISECFDILSKSALHIDGDSGLVHGATRMEVPCIVLWGPTPVDFYGYSQNINLKSSVCKEACYGVKDNWNDKCPIGYMSPKCMDEISPEQVFQAAESIL
jgi:ADP-heptose:LPS heptosyltransferase